MTALFCDLVGFTPTSDRLDPEEVRDIQATYFEAMRGQIERYGGTVEKFAGDAVLALFGTPVAHEDDAERAVLCALGMQAAVSSSLRGGAEGALSASFQGGLRVGVNTGEVVSGLWDAGGRQDIAVSGDAVNTAARIQAAAEPGEVLVGLETMRLTRRRIRYGERRELTLKGKVSTVPGYPALGLREQFGERWETSKGATPLIGRDRELVELLDTWIRAQGGDGQLVTVVGDAGVGKSRLITELLEKIGASAAIRVLRARCLSYGQEISLWLIADLLRNLFGIGEQDAADDVRPKLTAAVTGLLVESDGETLAEAIDVLGEVLGLPPGGSIVAHAGAQIRHQALIRNLRLLLGALARRTPTVVVLEDLHWLDRASAQVLTEILSDVPGLRLLVLAAHRPGYTAPWSDWGWTERLTLRPLREDDATRLAGAVLGGAALSPELEGYIAERAGGNPFFLEEMLRALEEAGELEERGGRMFLTPGAAERLPSTLTEVVLARLDRLDAPVRSVAQVASVIGRTFAVRLLAEVMNQDPAVLDAPLLELQRAEIAFPRRSSDIEYVFKHVSLREVAYNTLVQRRRQELHLATARAIAQLYPADEYVEMIAYHYSRTAEHAEAAAWLERAGDRAAGVYANETAIAQYEEARSRLQLSGAADQQVARLDEKLGKVLSTSGHYDEALVTLERSFGVYREARDLEAAGRVIAQIGLTHRHRGTAAEGIARLEPMLDMLASSSNPLWSGPSPGVAALHLALAQLFFITGRFGESLQAAERASELARAVGDDRLLGDAEQRRATGLMLMGRLEEGSRVFEEVVPLTESTGDLNALQLALGNLGETNRQLGRLDEARRLTERAITVAQRVGNPANTGFLLANLADLVRILGDWSAAESFLEQSAETLRPLGQSWYAAYPPLITGELRAGQGNRTEAVRLLEQTIAIAGPSGDRQALELAERALAGIEVAEGRPEAARARLEPLVQDDSPFLTELLPPLALAYLELGAIERATDTATEGVRVCQERGQPLMLVSALLALGTVLARQQQSEEAMAAFEEGLALARSLAYPLAEGRLLYQMGLLDRVHLRVGRSDPQRGPRRQPRDLGRQPRDLGRQPRDLGRQPRDVGRQPRRHREHLEAACVIFQRLGAKADLVLAEEALAAL